MQRYSRARMYFSGLSFLTALAMISLGIILMPADIWLKAYLATGTLFLITSCFTLSKTVRETSDQRDRNARINTTLFDRVLRESDMGVR